MKSRRSSHPRRPRATRAARPLMPRDPFGRYVLVGHRASVLILGTDAHSVQLSSKRRVNVTTFNKALLVNIREYYEAGGELKPGKKVRHC